MTERERSISSVLSAIVGDVQGIVRAEVRLAKAELREELGKARRGAMLLVGGGVFLVLALGLGLLAAVYGLATIWPAWAAALAVAVGTAVLGGLLAMSGKKQIGSVELPPQRTAATVRENLQWAKTRAK